MSEDIDLDFSGLRAMFINCTLKKSPEKSHTQGLVDASGGNACGVTNPLRPVSWRR